MADTIFEDFLQREILFWHIIRVKVKNLDANRDCNDSSLRITLCEGMSLSTLQLVLGLRPSGFEPKTHLLRFLVIGHPEL